MSKARHAAIGGVFSALSILLMFMSLLMPNIVRVAEFVLFIGYYPIIKMQLDNIDRIWLRRLIKLV